MSDPAPLVGRDREIGTIAAALAATRAGAGGCLVLTGDAGMGKTRLVERALADAHGSGLAVGAWRATELDRTQPLATLATALRRVQPDGVGLAELGRPDADAFWYFDRIGEAIETYVKVRPLVVVVDDAQWCDELSALALRVLVPSLASSPVRWLLARRPVPANSPARDAVDWLIGNGADEIKLGPLDPASVAQLCSLVLGATADATVLTLAERAGGSPFLIHEMLRSMRAADQIVVSDGAATAIGDALPTSFYVEVDHRLRGLDPATRSLLEAGAIFGRPFLLHSAAAIRGIAVTDWLTAAREALAAGVLVADGQRLAFVHDLLREAVYHHIPGPIRAALHREAATVVKAEGCPPTEVAEHFVLSGAGGDRAAVDALRSAAAELAPRAPGTAADLVVRALDGIGEHDPGRPQLCADAVGLLAKAGRLEKARQLGESALRGLLDPATEASVLLGLAEALKHAGRNGEAVEYARQALARTAVPDTTRAHLHAVAAHALLWSEDISQADDAGREAHRLGSTTGEHAAAVFGLAARSVVARAAGRLADARAHAEEANRIAEREGGAAAHRHPKIWLGSALAALDALKEAEEVLVAGQGEARRFGTAWSQPLWHFYHATVLADLGQLDDATTEAEAGQLLAAQLTARQLSVPLHGLLVRIAVRQGELAEAAHQLRQMRRLMADGVTAAPEDLAWASASLAAAQGEYRQAVSDLTYLYDRLPGRVLLFSNEPGAAPAMVRIALAAGEATRAEAAATAMADLAARNPGVASLAGSAAHARGLLASDLEALRAAVDHFEHSPRRLDRAQALADCAEAEQAAGHRARAVELLEAAIAEYGACGAKGAKAAAERTLRGVGVRATARRSSSSDGSIGATLTEAEGRVARHVVKGLSNREVAERLFISPHTVDSHLRKIFNKLGVNSRAQLIHLMVREDID